MYHYRKRREVAREPHLDIEVSMYRAAGVVLLVLMALPGCNTARDVAETSAHVATAPVRFVGRKIHGSDENQDVTNQVYEAPPVQQLPPGPPPSVRATPSVVRQQERSVTSSTSSQPAPATPTPALRSTTSSVQFPTAKPVPGKPGYVFSPYDPNGGYVDVTGYQSGSKVKDPYSQKIFLVP
jgi:hypothetical protein